MNTLYFLGSIPFNLVIFEILTRFHESPLKNHFFPTRFYKILELPLHFQYLL